MNSKINLRLLGLFIIVLSLNMISAATFSISPSLLKYTEPINELSITITPPAVSDQNPNYSYMITIPTIKLDNDQQLIFQLTGDKIIAEGNKYRVREITKQEVIKVKALNIDYDEISLGKSYTGDITVENSENAQDKLTIPIRFTGSFCSSGEQGTDLEITEVQIDNSDGEDDEWSSLDLIEINVEVSNDGSERIKDVFVELGLFDSDGKNIIRQMDDLNDRKIDLGNIKDGDEETATFKFTVPSDFEEGNYNLVVKAYSDDLGENDLCTSEASDLDNDFFQTITGEREEDEERHVIFHKIKLEPSPAQCGEIIQVSGDVANIGDTDYDDQVKVTLVNKDLGVDLEQIVRGDLEQGDSELVDFEFTVPINAQEKAYVLEFRTYYDYDKDDDEYSITSEQKFTQSLRVEGNCQEKPTPEKPESKKDVIINAELNPETPQAISGKQVAITVSLKNTGTSASTFILLITENSEWSTLVSIDPQVLVLAPGESKESNIILNVNPDIEGEKTFTIKASFDGITKEQKVTTVVVKEPTTNQFSPIIKHLRANWFIYLIIIVNIILIVAIILVIRSMMAPQPSL